MRNRYMDLSLYPNGPLHPQVADIAPGKNYCMPQSTH